MNFVCFCCANSIQSNYENRYLPLFARFYNGFFSTGNQTESPRDLGFPLNGVPGKFNAITDVPGVLVGYTTRIEGSGKWERWGKARSEPG
jgi:hypothetical protein